MATASALRDLRELLDLKFPDAAPLERHRTEVVATGIGELDRIFPSGGFPRGRLSVWTPGGGATAVLRSACRSAVAGGERAVWIDGSGTMAGAFWDAGPVLLRPKSRLHALRAAEALLRSGDSRWSCWQAPIRKEPRTCDSHARHTRAAARASRSRRAQLHRRCARHRQFVRMVTCGAGIRTAMRRWWMQRHWMCGYRRSDGIAERAWCWRYGETSCRWRCRWIYLTGGGSGDDISLVIPTKAARFVIPAKASRFVIPAKAGIQVIDLWTQ